jgi:hypothetical protein
VATLTRDNCLSVFSTLPLFLSLSLFLPLAASLSSNLFPSVVLPSISSSAVSNPNNALPSHGNSFIFVGTLLQADLTVPTQQWQNALHGRLPWHPSRRFRWSAAQTAKMSGLKQLWRRQGVRILLHCPTLGTRLHTLLRFTRRRWWTSLRQVRLSFVLPGQPSLCSTR